jgi:FKBP-type peptidyl-prolyl cis-trans isomerase (trigger factor)
MSKHTHVKGLKVERLPESEAEITGSLTQEFLAECRPEALSHLGERVSIPGFRKGRVPEDVLVKQIGEMHILEEVAEIALAREYPAILEEAKLSPVGRPNVSITKVAPGIDLEFKIRVPLEPEFKLPDYKKIAKDVSARADELEVSDEEVEKVLKELEGREEKTELKEGETLPDKVKENLIGEKKFRAREKKRLALVEELVKASEIAVPKTLAESELEKMLAQFKDDVEKMGVSFDKYLAELKKTSDEIKKEWMPQAIERVKAELIVTKIAAEEKIEPKPEEVEHEAKHLLEHYPEADPLRVRVYVYTMLRNQKVLEFLENQK